MLKNIPLLRWLTASALILLVSACSPVTVHTDYDPTYSFDAQKSVAWLKRPAVENSAEDQLTYRRIEKAIEAKMGALGYRWADKEAADLLVTFHTSTEKKLRVDTIYDSYGYNYWGVPSTASTYVREYEVGSLLIDLIDPESRNLVWRGTAQAIVGDGGTPEKRTKLINEAVDRVFTKFPPKK